METGRINTPVSFSSIPLTSCWCSALAGRQGHPLMAFIQVSPPGHGAGWSTAERGSAGAHGRDLARCFFFGEFAYMFINPVVFFSLFFNILGVMSCPGVLSMPVLQGQPHSSLWLEYSTVWTQYSLSRPYPLTTIEVASFLRTCLNPGDSLAILGTSGKWPYVIRCLFPWSLMAG